MVELYNDATQDGPRNIEELPPSVNVYHYKGIDHYCRVVSLERDRLHSFFSDPQDIRAQAISGSCDRRQEDMVTLPQMEGAQSEDTQSDHIIFIIQPSTFTQDFLESEPPLRTKLSFDPKTNILTVRMPLSAHEGAIRAFEWQMYGVLEQMGLQTKIEPWGSGRLTGADDSIKEPDGGWGPKRPPRGVPRRPSVVLEVASSQIPGKLRRDCKYWVDPAKGQAEMAIGVKIDPNNPRITISQWQWSVPSSRPIETSELTITRSDCQVDFNTNQPIPQLLIPFRLLFRRQAVEDRERDIVFGVQELTVIATTVWDKQFKNEEE
jgi:hypothetical protein